MQALFPRLAVAALLASLIAGCATGPLSGSGSAYQQREAAAQALADQGNNAEAAKRYEALADASSGQARGHARVMAAEQWRAGAFPEKARELLKQIDTSALAASDRVQFALTHAELALQDDNPREALDWLQQPQLQPTQAQQSTLLQVRARALFKMGSAIDATRLLIKRGGLLSANQARLANQRLIWDGLTQSREPLDASALPAGSSDVLRGWVSLGAIGRSLWQAPNQFRDRIQAWQESHPAHPANDALIAQVLDEYQRLYSYPARVALLLPLTGPYADAGKAIRDGLLAARYQTRNDRNPPRITVYDTHGNGPGATKAYQAATAAGAGLVVGPLTKEAVSAIAKTSRTAPVLALNYLDDIGPAPTRALFYQFGLAPEDEARQAAERLVQEGLTRGIALAPDSDWGNRMMLAFKKRFETLGGTLLDGEYYRPNQNDFSTPIVRALNVDASQRRYRQLRATLGLDIQFEPRRRQDVQFVFMAARERDAKLIRPQLKFHQGLGLPVYATSSVFEPSAGADSDLNGIAFADMPWIISPDTTATHTENQLRALWPERFGASPRLFALGFDAYRLVPLMANSLDPLQHPVPGATGILHMDKEHRIHRDLFWARIRNGKPVLLPPPAEKAEAPTANADSDNDVDPGLIPPTPDQ